MLFPLPVSQCPRSESQRPRSADRPRSPVVRAYCTCAFLSVFFFFFQTLSLNKSSGGGEDVHQGFQNLLSEVNRTDTRYLLRTANGLFGDKTYDFLSVSHTPDCPKHIETEVVWRREAGLVLQTGLVG